MNRPLRILELSVPNATVEGTLQAAMHLPKKIADSGINTVFVLPWMKVNTALSRSPYAIVDHLQMNERIGNLDDAKRWVDLCRSAGLHVVLDMPLNHTSPNHVWTSHSDWYLFDENGIGLPPVGTRWHDVLQLNHSNTEVAEACAEVLHFWGNVGIDGFRFDAASFIPDGVLESWISSLMRSFQKEFLLWCDGEAYSMDRPMFNGFLFHEAFYQAKEDHTIWNRLIQRNPTSAIFYLTNHDTLHAGNSPINEWPIDYRRIRTELESSSHHFMLSWSDWHNPRSRYSFML